MTRKANNALAIQVMTEKAAKKSRATKTAARLKDRGNHDD